MKRSEIAGSVLLLGILFLAVAYGNDLRAKQGVQVSRWPNGNPRVSSEARRYPDGRLESDGAYQSFFRNGKKQLQGQYRHGLRSGLWREWNADGFLLKEGYYRKGKMDGNWRYYDPEGPTETILWKKGRMVGGDDSAADEESSAAYFSWAGHLGGIALSLLWIFTPLPLLFALLRGFVRWAEWWVASLCSWTVIQLCVAFLLSALGWLNAAAFFGLQAALLVGGLVVWARAGRPVPRLLPVCEDRASLLLAGSALVLTLAVLAKTLLVPMTDWDGLAYHLPLVAQWLQHHQITALPWLGQTAHYPLHWELLSLLGYFPFREDFLFGAPAVGAFALLGCSVFVLARRAGARGQEAAASTLLLLSFPLVLMQTEELKSDLPLAAFFTAALCLGGFLDSSRGKRSFPLLVLTLGVVCGLKATGPLYAVLVIVLLWIWSRLDAGSEKLAAQPPRGSRVVAWSAIVLACALASFWYVRNLVQVGNPLGLVQLSAFGHVIFPGDLSGTNLARTNLFAVFQPLSTHDWSLALANGRRWLGVPILVLIVGAIVAVSQELRARNALSTKLLLLAAIAACGILFGFTPFSGDNGTHGWHYSLWSGQAMRFALPKLAMASVLAALGFGFSRVSRTLFWGFAVFMCAWSVALRVALPRTQLVEIVLFALFVILVWKFLTRPGEKAKRENGRSRSEVLAIPAFVVISLLLLALWSHGAREFRELHRKKSYDLPYLHALQEPADEVVGVAMTQLRYPFYGRDLMRHVEDVSCRACTHEEWLKELREKKIDLVAVGQTSVQDLLEVKETDLRPWLTAPDAPFEALEGVGGGVGSGIEFYRRVSQEP